ncbi:MAG: NAD(P)H-hydrate dehydratase [Chitinophagales bacterium]
MKILSPAQLREADALTIASENIEGHELMERAALLFTQLILARFTQTNKILVVCGTGNNGGDGLCIARHLHLMGYKVHVCIIPLAEPTAEFALNLLRLKKYSVPIIYIESAPALSNEYAEVIIDAILGTGISREVTGMVAEIIQHINQWNKYTISVDVPSGFIAEQPTTGPCIRADYCITFQSPKLGFLFEENSQYVKQWQCVDIGLSPDYIRDAACANFFTLHADIAHHLTARNTFVHKGTLGHTCIIAGSELMQGAAQLCGAAALKTGCGLVTIALNNPAFYMPELMFTPPENVCDFIQNKKIKSIALGPGLGTNANTKKILGDILQFKNIPLVIDADGINTLAQNPEFLSALPAGTILTPHPLEFERLFGKAHNAFERLRMQKLLSQQYQITIVFKTAFTCITLPDGTAWFNSTGNPALATAGSGDVLTGIIASLLAQGYRPTIAAILGAYLHGLAADIAIKELHQNVLIASDIIHFIPKAIQQITI